MFRSVFTDRFNQGFSEKKIEFMKTLILIGVQNGRSDATVGRSRQGGDFVYIVFRCDSISRIGSVTHSLTHSITQSLANTELLHHLKIGDSRQQTGDIRQPTSDIRQQVAGSRQKTTNSRPQTTDSRQQI